MSFIGTRGMPLSEAVSNASICIFNLGSWHVYIRRGRQINGHYPAANALLRGRPNSWAPPLQSGWTGGAVS
jgi:hypothetical protein